MGLRALAIPNCLIYAIFQFYSKGYMQCNLCADILLMYKEHSLYGVTKTAFWGLLNPLADTGESQMSK